MQMRGIITSVVVAAAIAGFINPLAAAAQDRRIHVNIGGGPTFPLGEVDERFTMGWGPALGVSFDITPRVAAQLPIAEKIARADYVIDTSGTKGETDAQVRHLFEQLQSLPGA